MGKTHYSLISMGEERRRPHPHPRRPPHTLLLQAGYGDLQQDGATTLLQLHRRPDPSSAATLSLTARELSSSSAMTSSLRARRLSSSYAAGRIRGDVELDGATSLLQLCGDLKL
jgi:hypothetical protein